MRRLGMIIAIIALTMLPALTCFADSLEIVDSYPRDGGTGLQPVNCAVKLYFNQDVSGEKYMTANSTCFRITGPDKKALPITVLHDSKDTSMVLVVLKDTLAEDTEYKLTISGDFTATSGDMLEKNKTITFRTRSTKNDGKVSMVMMGVMFVGIIIFSSRQMKRQTQKDAEAKEKNAKVNPYKVSKKTGKSVEDIVKKEDKIKRKKAAEEAKVKAAAGDNKETKGHAEEEEEVSTNIRVSGPRPISAAGSTYKSGKKAKAEAAAKKKAAERSAGTTKPKNQQAKKRNKNKKK